MADRYWVGGGSSTNWNATGPTNWSASSGGANDASVPGSSDNVFFDANSGSGGSVISASISVLSLDCDGYTGTLTHNSAVNLTIGDNALVSLVRFSAGMTYTPVSTTANIRTSISFGGHINFTSNGQAIGSLTLNRTNGALVLVDDMTVNGAVTFTRGVLNLNGNNLSCGSISSSNSNWRSVISGGTYNTIYAGTTAFGVVTIGILGGDDTSSETNQQVGQSFSAGSTVVYGASFFLSSTGSPTDNVVVSLRNSLSGDLIASKTIPSASLVSNQFNNFVFDSPASVTQGETYYFILSRSGARDAANYWSARTYSLLNTTAGSVFERNNNSWDAGNAYDLNYIVFEKISASVELTTFGTVWNFGTSTNASVWGDATIELTNNSSSSKVFTGGGLSYFRLHNNTQSTGILLISGSNTFDTLEIEPGRDVVFVDGTTQTIGTLIADNASFSSQSPGLSYTLSSPNTNTISALTIQDATASGAGVFRILNVVDNGNNTGWVYVEEPTVVNDQPALIGNNRVNINVEIANLNNSNVTRIGVVFSTSSQTNPGNVAPESSLYSIISSSTASYGVGNYTILTSGLSANTTYFYRVFGQNEAGYGYSDELQFNTATFQNTQTQDGVISNIGSVAVTVNAMETTNTSPTNQTTTASGIINSTTASTGVTNL